MCQWLKRYFDLNYNGEPYDALERRKGADLYYIGAGNKPQPLKNKGLPAKKAPTKAGGYVPGAAKKTSGIGGGAAGGAGSAADKKKIGELTGELEELKMTADTLEKERDFYFAKLRDIEILLQNQQSEPAPISDMVMKILYATEDEKVEVDEEGNLTITDANGNVVGDAPEEEMAPADGE